MNFRACLSLTLASAVALAAVSCIAPDARDDRASPTDSTLPDATHDDVGSLSVASNFAALGEFVGYVDPERGIFEVRMVDDLDDPSTVRDELIEAHQRTTVSGPTGWCEATVDRDGTPGTGAAGTVELYTPWGEIDKTIDACLSRIGDDSLSETSFPNGVLCADVIVRSFFTSDLENVYAEITSHNGSSNQYGYAFPLGNGAERPDFGRDRPDVDFGLWSYGNLTTAQPEEKVVWTFKFGSTTPFTFGGRVVYSVAEDCDNDADDDCDGVADNACNEFHEGTTCIIDADCAGDSFCDGGALDSGSGDIDGACKCNTVDPPYHDGACSATCGDGTQNGAEEGIDCGGPCNPCSASDSTLVSSIPDSSGYFGVDVSLDGETIVVGAQGEDSREGAAYVFERQSDGTWMLRARLKASDAGTGDNFGSCVAVSGDRAAVGAKGEASSRGAVYTFERQTDGSWVQTDKIVESSTLTGDEFGSACSLDGEYLAIGTPLHFAEGVVFIYTRQSDATWGSGVEVSPSFGGSDSEFGSAVSLDGDRLAVGAPLLESGNGGVYVYDRQTSGSWIESDFVPTEQSGSEFGSSVSLDADRIAVGAPAFTLRRASAGGLTIIVERQSDGSWISRRHLSAGDSQDLDFCGRSVALSGDRVVVGCSGEDSGGTNAGAAYFFERQTDGTWSETNKWTSSNAEAGDGLGNACALDGTRAVVGARYAEVSSIPDAGKVHVIDTSALPR